MKSGPISVTAPINSAIDRVRRVLFRPFDLRKWFVIGFCAWLATLGQGGFHSGFNTSSWNKRSGEGGRELFEQIKDYVMSNLYWIVPVALVAVLFGLALWVLFLWLSSRGQFMFLHCVALDKAEVEQPWRRYVHESNSLFWFRLALGLVAMLLMLPLAAFAGWTVFQMIGGDGPTTGGIVRAAVLGLALAGLGIGLAIITKLTKDFVVPILYLHGGTCGEAWRRLGSLLRSNVGGFVLYLLFQILLAIVIGLVLMIVVIVTCCIAGCLLAIPYLGTVLLLPILMFSRCYSLYYIAQYGPQYDVFAPPAPASTGFPPPPGPASPMMPA